MLYLSLRHYEYVEATARHGSLSVAAQALHVSQPALSAALSRIEDVLGQSLFIRRRGAALVLTPQGQHFAMQARVLLDQAAKLERNVGTSTGPSQLAIGFFVDLAPFLMAPTIRQPCSAPPDLTLAPRTDRFDALIAALNAGQLDIAVTYDLGLDAGFHRTELMRMSPHALVPPGHDLANLTSTRLKDLARHDLILSNEGLSIQHMLGLFRTAGHLPAIRHRAASLELLRSLAANGEGVGLSYATPPTEHSYDGKPLVAIPVTDPIAQEPIVAVTHAAIQTGSHLAHVIRVLKEVAKSLEQRST
ncbi:MAG: LysR family transcriptional regulator [Paracoccaceae bacterium]